MYLRFIGTKCFLLAAFFGCLVTPSWGQVVNEDIKLLANDGASFDQFGRSIAIDNGVVAIGAFGADSNGCSRGAAYLFDSSTGVKLFKLLATGGTCLSNFGYSIDIANGVVAVGAYLEDDNGFAAGTVYLFDVFSGAQIDKLLPDDGSLADFFGLSVAISNGVVAVGAYQDDDNGLQSGSAYLFDVSTGAQIVKLLPNDGAADDNFGRTIAIGNGVVAVGAVLDDDNGSASGSVYLFDAATGVQLVKLLPSDGAAGDQFGSSVAIDNGIVAVGSFDDDDNGTNSGSAYLFDASTGAQLTKLLPKDGASNDDFGFSIAIDNGVVVVGASSDLVNGSASGSAYLFDVSTGAQIVKLIPSDGAIGDFFGWSIGISNGVVSVGVPYDDDNGGQSGSAYVFSVSPSCIGDLDGDGQSNLDDFGVFFDCASGPGQPVGVGCDPTDIDSDGDADLADFAILQNAFGCQ